MLVHQEQMGKLKGYVLPGEGRRRDKVRIHDEIDQGRGTHSLEMTEKGTTQDMERK